MLNYGAATPDDECNYDAQSTSPAQQTKAAKPRTKALLSDRQKGGQQNILVQDSFTADACRVNNWVDA